MVASTNEFGKTVKLNPLSVMATLISVDEYRSIPVWYQIAVSNLWLVYMPRRTRNTVKLTVCLCVFVRAVTAQRLQCDEK